MSPKEDRPADRKDQILAAAADLFAEQGYYKTTTADVARAVGVTQPYIFHFFKTKEALYLAVLEQATELIAASFRSVEAPRDEMIEAMGQAFKELLHDHRNVILLVMMAFATPDESIRAYTRARFDEVFETIRSRFEAVGMPNHQYEAGTFIGQGLLITMSEVLQLPKLAQCLDQTHHD